MKPPYPTLYARANTGKVQQWTIFVVDDYFYTEAGQVGGKITRSKPNYCTAMNVGKKNEVSPEDQAELEAYAKYLKKLKSGYKEDIRLIDEVDFIEPMLAKSFKDYADKITYPIGYEEKLNGGRGNIYINKGLLWMYSRKGEKFNCIIHFIKSVEALYKKYPNLVLDGEIYNPALKHNLGKLMSIVSVNRVPEDIPPEDYEEAEKMAQFHVYDAYGYNDITQKTPWCERKAALQSLLRQYKLKYLYYHGFKIAKNRDEINAAKAESAKNGDEGLIIKDLVAPYENKRSKYFLKLKNWEDAEFEIVGFTEGSGNWAGCVKTVICKLPKPNTQTGETTFDSQIRGSMEELAELWKRRNEFIGKIITVDFQEWSPYGVPLIPYTDCFVRNYE